MSKHFLTRTGIELRSMLTCLPANLGKRGTCWTSATVQIQNLTKTRCFRMSELSTTHTLTGCTRCRRWCSTLQRSSLDCWPGTDSGLGEVVLHFYNKFCEVWTLRGLVHFNENLFQEKPKAGFPVCHVKSFLKVDRFLWNKFAEQERYLDYLE